MDNLTKETSLADLKRAIEAIGGSEPPLFGDEPLFENYGRLSDFHRRKAVAWRTAFEWRNGVVESPVTQAALTEYAEGMRLIREKLK